MLYMDGGLVLAAFIMAYAPSLHSLLAGRFLAGCASGISLMAAVSYLAELSSAERHHAHRGALVSTVEASVSLGVCVIVRAHGVGGVGRGLVIAVWGRRFLASLRACPKVRVGLTSVVGRAGVS